MGDKLVTLKNLTIEYFGVQEGRYSIFLKYGNLTKMVLKNQNRNKNNKKQNTRKKSLLILKFCIL